ncbi:unnamed protein product, partial [Iphiclides podalirius]
MNVLRTMFGVCSGSAEKGEIHDMVRKIFGNELVLKDNTDRQNQLNNIPGSYVPEALKSKYLTHIRDNLTKVLDVKIMSHKSKFAKKHAQALVDKHDTADERPGRIGPKIVVFDASTGTGRLVLVGDERVSVQGLSSFATIRATACVYAGKWMFEVQLGTKGIMQIGWCTAGCTFSMDTGVGDTANSYAYDGGRVRRWNVATSPYGHAWLPGDVIGCCLDLDRGNLEFFRNGESMGVAFDNVTHGTGIAYFPAVSLAMQEHLYANFGHVPFVFPVEGYAPLQAPPGRECAKAALLFKSLDTIIDDLLHLSDFKTVGAKSSKAKSDASRIGEEEVALRIDSTNSVYSPRASPTNVLDVQSAEVKKMSRKAFLMSLGRLVVIELGACLKLSYVVIGELLTRFRGHLGLRSRSVNVDPQAAEFFATNKAANFEDLSAKILTQPHVKLCVLLDLLWTFLDESALCDVLEHCVVRECLLFDSVSPVMESLTRVTEIHS